MTSRECGSGGNIKLMSTSRNHFLRINVSLL